MINVVKPINKVGTANGNSGTDDTLFVSRSIDLENELPPSELWENTMWFPSLKS